MEGKEFRFMGSPGPDDIWYLIPSELSDNFLNVSGIAYNSIKADAWDTFDDMFNEYVVDDVSGYVITAFEYDNHFGSK